MACKYAAQWAHLGDHVSTVTPSGVLPLRDCIDAMITPDLWCEPCTALRDIRCANCGTREKVDSVLICPDCGSDMCPTCTDICPHGGTA